MGNRFYLIYKFKNILQSYLLISETQTQIASFKIDLKEKLLDFAQLGPQ